MSRLGRVLASLLLVGCGRVAFAPLDLDSARDATSDALECSEPPGLLGHWTLDAADIQGTSARDVSGRSLHGRIEGVPLPAVVPGPVGEALDFAATTSGAVVLDAVPFDLGLGRFNTIAVWVRNDDPNVDGSVAFFPAPNPRYDLWMTVPFPGRINLCINTGTGECWGMDDDTGQLLGRWVFVVAVLVNGQTDGGRLYLDGVDIGASCTFGTCTQSRTIGSPFALGGRNDVTYPWRGSFDDLRIFDRALTADEVARLYACAR